MLSRALLAAVAFVACTLCSTTARSQDEIGEGVPKLDQAGISRLRSILARPLPADRTQWVAHFNDMDRAAVQLGDSGARQKVLRSAIEALPDNAFMRNSLALVLIENGEFAQAEKLSREAIALARVATNKAIFIRTLAANRVATFRHAEAAALIDQAEAELREGASDRELSRQVNRLRVQSSLHRLRSTLAERAGRPAEALAQATEAVVVAHRAIDLSPNAAMSRRSDSPLFNAYVRKFQALQNLNRYGEAEQTAVEAAQVAADFKGDLRSAILLEAIADMRFAQRDYSAALRLFSQADAMFDALGYSRLYPKRIDCARATLQILWLQHRTADAQSLLGELDLSLKDEPDGPSRALLPLERGLVLLSAGDAAAALRLLERHAQQTEQRFGARSMQAALARGLTGVARRRALPDGGGTETLDLLAGSVVALMDASLDDAALSTHAGREMRELVFGAYLDLASSSRPTDATELVGFADWLRSSATQDAVADAAARTALNDPAMVQLVRREQDARNEAQGLRRALVEAAPAKQEGTQDFQAVRRRISQLEQERAELQRVLRERFPEYEQLVRPRSADVAQVRAVLRGREALVVALPTNEALYLWVVRPDRPAAFARVPTGQPAVARLVRSIRATVEIGPGGPPAFSRADAIELSTLVMTPLRGALEGVTGLIVVASGALAQLPFGLLPDGEGWLAERFSIAHAPSVQAWLTLRRSKAATAPEALIAWGDPSFSGKEIESTPGRTRPTGLGREASPERPGPEPRPALDYARVPPLPETREELRAIADALNADPSADLVLGTRATRESVLAASRAGTLARKRVIVFATHGLKAGDLPALAQPALAMAGPATDSAPLPLLTLEDVLGLRMAADWVVLSACNTAAADGRSEEALSGLARGFFYAGARSVLVTHWAVDSESAKALTTLTFQHYAATPAATKAESLRQAMLKVMRMPQYAHPAYWAPYALVGDGAR